MENMNVGTTLTEYEELEQNIIAVIKKCNNENMKESITKDVQSLFNVKNATSARYYALDNGLNVYVILNGDNAIDYMISSEPLYTKSTFIGGDNKEHSNNYYSETSCIEYSVGGIGNGVPVDDDIMNTKYVDTKHVAFLGPNYRGSRLQKEIVAGQGTPLSTPEVFRFVLDETSLKYKSEGKMISYLTSLKLPKYTKQKTLDFVEKIKTTVGKVKEKAQEQTVEQKKGFFRNRLAKNKKLDEQMEIFGKQGQVR